MRKETLKNLIDLIPEEDLGTLYKVIIKFIPTALPLPDEVEAIAEAKADLDAVISHDEIDWE